MTVTTVDKLLVAIGIGLWVTLILAVIVVFVAIRRNNRGADAVVAYESGWADGTLAALAKYGPGTDQPEERLLWIAGITQIEPNPYLEADVPVKPDHGTRRSTTTGLPLEIDLDDDGPIVSQIQPVEPDEWRERQP